MEKRLILALTFSILILVIWGIMFPQPKQTSLEKPLVVPKEPLFNPQKEIVSTTQPIVTQKVRERKSGENVVVEYPLYKAVFSTEGGVLTSFQLKNYPEEKIREKDIDKAIFSSRDETLTNRLRLLKEMLPEAQSVEMVSLFSRMRALFPFSLYWQDESLDLNYNLYDIDRKDKSLIFSSHIQGLKVVKKYIFREDSYLIDIEIGITNEATKIFPASPLVVQCGPGIGLSTDPFGKGDPSHRPLVLIKEAGREKVIRENFRRGKPGVSLTKSYPDAIWGGLENKYFMAVFLPPPEPHSFLLEKDPLGQLNVRLKLQMPELTPGRAAARRFSIYLGPKQKEVLTPLGQGLDKSVDYGALASALRIMDILRFFYRLFRNWGVAIIILTILSKIILLPFTQKSLHSMEKMQKLQPILKELRLKYKDDPRRMQKETMELYRREGVNPMGGCLPMLVQMPIFIALFTTLRNTIDLRGAHFLWIKDLSMPDTVCYISGIPINPLPLVMGLSMFWQQKMSTADPEQAKMMMFMPIMFTVMFYNFSSGLVLYWFVQNILTIAHQQGIRILKKNEKQ